MQSKHSKFVYNSRIVTVTFSITGSEAAKRDSHVAITSPDLSRGDDPAPGGVDDGHLGPKDFKHKCQTCYHDKKYCLGHEGHYVLRYPVWNPMGINEGRKWLRLVCFQCGRPVIPDAAFSHIPAIKRLDEASKMAKGNKLCVHCGKSHSIIKKNKKEPLEIIVEGKEGDKRPTVIYPHEIKDIFAKITDETVIKLGKDPASHPSHFILDIIKVPSIIIRPDVRKMGSKRSSSNPLTAMLQIIIKKSESMESIIPDVITPPVAKAILELNNAYYDFIRAGGEEGASVGGKLKGKPGQLRKNTMGKRVWYMCRSTIIGHPFYKIDEIGVPMVFAKTIKIRETVQEGNRARLTEYVLNGQDKYPGASKVIKKRTGAVIDVSTTRDVELQIGDVVLRDLMDGDPVNFNRQPSLMPSNIACHRAVIITDPSIKTLILNVIACPLYGADFDGDLLIWSQRM